MTEKVTAARPTLAQVAAEAGVSKATASKVLNGRPSIAAETRARVEEAIRNLGYAPSTGPRPAGGTPKVASVVLDNFGDLYCMRVLEGVTAAARTQGVEILVDALNLPGQGLVPLSERWLRHQAAHQRTGVIVVISELTAGQRRLMRSLGLATVQIDPINPLDDGSVSIAATNFHGAMQATQHLLDLGHRRIAFAGGLDESMPARERLHGYLAALAAAGVEHDEALVLKRAFNHEAGVEMATAFLALQERPTAIFAGSDTTALGVLEAARRRGLRVPEDLSVVGFDDTYAATASAPPLTTVRQPLHEMGRVALRTLLQQARGEPLDSHHVQLSTQLVVRESTAPPAAR